MNQLTHLVVALRGGRWPALLRLITTPDGKHKSGGWQNRKRKWLTKVNEAARSIELDEDDIAFVQRMIKGKNGGGWQKYFYDIFVDTAPQFTGLPITPRKKPGERRHRTPITDVVSDVFVTQPQRNAVMAKKSTHLLPDRLKIRSILPDLEGAVCGSTTHCVLANTLKRLFPNAFVRVVANRVTISQDGILNHYALPDSALRMVALNDQGTLNFATADRVVMLKIIDRRKAYIDLSPERRAGIRKSEADRRAAGTLKTYSKNTRIDAAKRAGKLRKKVLEAEAHA